MTLEQQMRKWLEDHNGEPPGTIAFSPSLFDKIPRVGPSDSVEIGGFKINLIKSDCMKEGEALFMSTSPFTILNAMERDPDAYKMAVKLKLDSQFPL